jgi:rRNA-processing protein EBP2
MGKKQKQKQEFDISSFIQSQDVEQLKMEDIELDQEPLEEQQEQEPMEQEQYSEDEREMAAYLQLSNPKIFKNEKVALLERLQDISVGQEWIDTIAIDSLFEIVDHEDDLKREVAFYEQALDSATKARNEFQKLKIPFSRPADYFAEMLKSDQHMEKIRVSLLEEQKQIQQSEQAKKQRDLKKFGKKIQTEKLQQRQAQKTKQLEKIKEIRKKGVSNDDFDIDVDVNFINC